MALINLSSRYDTIVQKLAKKTAEDIHKTLDAEVVKSLSDSLAKDAAISGSASDFTSCLIRWRQRAIVAGYSSMALGVLLLGVSSASKKPLERLITSHAVIALYVLGKRQFDTANEVLPIAGTLARISAAKSALSLAELWNEKPATETLPPVKNNAQFFDWELFETKPDKFAHLAIVGASGDGKSTLTTNLALKVFTGKTFVVAPHYKPGDWEGLPCFAKGRNYGSKDDETFSFSSLTENEIISAASFIKSLELEMDRRYKLYEVGNDDYPMFNVILDEFLAIVDTISELMEPTRKLLREARKVRIRLILLLQDDSVKSLKIEGQGAIRKNLKYIRLGEFALAHSKALKNPEIDTWIKSREFPCLVEDMPAIQPC